MCVLAIEALLGDAWSQIHRTRDQILCSTTTDATFHFRKTREIPSPRCENQSILLNCETVIRSTPVVMRLPDLRHPMLELHGLFEFIRSFRLLKQVRWTPSRWVVDPYALVVSVVRSNIGDTSSFAFKEPI